MLFDSNFPDLGDWNLFLKDKVITFRDDIFDSNFPDLGDWNKKEQVYFFVCKRIWFKFPRSRGLKLFFILFPLY